MLEYRNTPDRDKGRSPAQVLYGRQLRDFIPVQPGKYKPRAEWLLTMDQWEHALARRHLAKGKELAQGTKDHGPLVPGTVVMVQNQVGKSALKWDKSGVVLADRGNSQYLIKLDGSGRTTLRNRAFLKRVTPFRGREELRTGVSQDLKRGQYLAPADLDGTGAPDTSAVGPTAERSARTQEPEAGVREGDSKKDSDDAQPPVRRSQRQVHRPEKYSK